MPTLSQDELKQLESEGKIFIFSYRRVFQIKWSHGAKRLVMQQIKRSFSGLPYVGRGRFITLDLEDAKKLEPAIMGA